MRARASIPGQRSCKRSPRASAEEGPLAPVHVAGRFLPQGRLCGYKQSGYGKDLSAYALEDYTRIKHVMANLNS
ncbi:MAG: hypothetical protein DWQ40_08635 [Actinobacteria bacterium]|nr:MAG: hypothetical protein DWQ40_08635 [Actinomycetota bacterium]REK34007.1 MAG: hypothetical protein DWQ20_07160 [Actinomycetota bacterium]